MPLSLPEYVRRRESGTSGPGTLAPYFAACIAVAIAYIAMRMLHPMPIFPLDDPYITLHSAQVLHWGFDPNYPGISPLYGTTSAPFLGLVYLLLFALPPLFALDTACWLGVLLYTFGLVRLARTFRLTRAEELCFVILGLTASFIPFHLVNGLETSWALAGVVWTLALGSGKSDEWKWAAVVAGLTASVRPDLLPFAALVVVALTFQSYRAHNCLRETMVRAISFASLALFAILPWALWYYHTTGVPFPLTGLAKRYFVGGDNLAWRDKADTAAYALTVYLGSCGPLVLAPPKVARHPLGKAVLLSFVLFVAAIYIQFPITLAWNQFRYPIVLTPMMLWAIGLSMTAPEERARQQTGRIASCMHGLLAGISPLLHPFLSTRVQLLQYRPA